MCGIICCGWSSLRNWNLVPATAMAISMLRRAHATLGSSALGAARARAFSSSASSLISEEEVRRFEEDGATVVRQLFPPEWLDQLRAAAELNMKNPGVLCDEHVKPGEPGRFHDDQFLWRRHETMRRFVYESPAAEIARHMMRGKQVQLFYDQLFVKEPGTRKATPWHNDHSYWQLKGNQVISLWLALDPVPKSSCVKYVKGSHKWRLLHKISSFSGDEQRYKESSSLPDIPDIESKRDEFELLTWDMEPGDCLVHHSFAVHGAPGISTQSGRRRAYATRWFGEDVDFDPRPGTMHHMWVNAGLDPGLKAEEPLKSSLFPKVTPAPEVRV
ncbi:hypothetical protein KC19_4G020300 [Ceratodon purpureus]|uniref:Phytanoyl-CoA dioxygenase n=3 Tax=Ceratodon purpureus TaxID=3225 RepID=A0A8T0I5W8_CERPU|nr:hypothetical protein KC19_4G020300 [Ceratodon purpureus]